MASDKKGQSTFESDSDVHISFEDQQKINRFARMNAKMEDLKEELKMKQNELKNIEEACDEVALLDYDTIPYRIGEVFVHQNVENSQSCLEAAKEKKQKEIENLKSQTSVLKNTMDELKAQLYAKFGNHINLEADED